MTDFVEKSGKNFIEKLFYNDFIKKYFGHVGMEIHAGELIKSLTSGKELIDVYSMSRRIYFSYSALNKIIENGLLGKIKPLFIDYINSIIIDLNKKDEETDEQFNKRIEELKGQTTATNVFLNFRDYLKQFISFYSKNKDIDSNIISNETEIEGNIILK